MAVLEGLEPSKVFHYFEEICKIPHGSGNVKQISDYLKNFAARRGLFCIQDELYNIIIIKEAGEGYEDEEPYILQGHMDMVAVKEPDCDMDMAKEPLRLMTDHKKVWAERTGLGGDDGIAVAYCLALLDDDTIAHPRLEVVLTVDEETGMEGAKGIDLSMLKGKRLINLDSEEEGILLAGCAGGARADVCLPVEKERCGDDLVPLRLSVKGLKGGHSGTEINRGGGNANCLLGRIMYTIMGQFEIKLSAMQGGLADNAIPREAVAAFFAKPAETEEIRRLVKGLEETIRKELAAQEPSLDIELVVGGEELAETKRTSETNGSSETDGHRDAASDIWVLSETSAKTAVRLLLALPNGVQAMSADVEGLVETSLNLGIMQLTDEAFTLEYALRSSVESAKEALCSKLRAAAELAGASVQVRNAYPGWKYQSNSPLRDKMVRIYEKMYGEKPQIQAIHAGLECGFFVDKLPGMDCISMGPDMKDIHTTEECLDIASTKRTWEYLLAVLADPK